MISGRVLISRVRPNVLRMDRYLGDLGMLMGRSASHEDDKRAYLRLSETICGASGNDLAPSENGFGYCLRPR